MIADRRSHRVHIIEVEVHISGSHGVPSPVVLVDQMLCAVRRISPARSPMMTQGAMVLAVVTRGMMEPSAMRRLSTPYTLRLPSTTDRASRPILAVQVTCQ